MSKKVIKVILANPAAVIFAISVVHISPAPGVLPAFFHEIRKKRK